MHNPAHPGYYLRQAYLEPLNVTVSALSSRIGVTRKAASELVNGKTAVSVEMAHRLGSVTATGPDFWLAMQMQFDLWQAQQARLSESLAIEAFDFAAVAA